MTYDDINSFRIFVWPLLLNTHTQPQKPSHCLPAIDSAGLASMKCQRTGMKQLSGLSPLVCQDK